MSDLPHADYIAAVRAALTAGGLGVRDSWTNGFVRRPSTFRPTTEDEHDGGLHLVSGQFHDAGWDEPDTVWLGWDHHRGWSLTDEDSALMPIHYSGHALPLSEPFAEPAAVAAAVREWLPGPAAGTPARSDRWARADEAEAAVRAWHDRHGRCLTAQDDHILRVDEPEPSGCGCTHQPCGSVARRDIHEDCLWHSGRINPLRCYTVVHAAEKCPGPASGR
ncbi:hypothetical protein AB0D08_29825 [Kitasatospora sp. NPDC048540]|uniref:hypothetical protein n=1 Tax=Kitasatospora sp. NPDC048540 TaxID=3155634 RepID=UPI0033BFEF0E